MRLQRVSPLLLLLAPSLAAAYGRQDAALKDAVVQDAAAAAGASPSAVAQNVKKDGVADTPAVRKPYKGTEAAPVDGLDGKPHQGPFVDKKPETTRTKVDGSPASSTAAKSRPTSLDKFAAAAGTADDQWRPEDIPEKNDGVMNDANRVAPKKGTTGTEGGITETEQERERLRKNLENKPQPPTEQPPLPHSEEQRIDAEQRKSGDKTVQKASTKEEERSSDATKRKGTEAGAGGLGIEKPIDLPDKPHDRPHPEPKAPTKPSSNTDTSLKDTIKDGIVNTAKEGESWLKKTMPYTEGKTNPKVSKKTQTSTNSGATTSELDVEASEADDEETWHEWFHSFVLSFTMIIFSEIGDKTFLVAALMAMRHARLLVFSAALSALVVMTILSAVLGHAVPTLLPQRLTTFAAALLFLVFGARMLREGLAMPSDSGVGEEMKEVEAELEEQEHDMALGRNNQSSSSSSASASAYSLEAGRGRKSSRVGGGGEKRDFLLGGEPSPPASRSPSKSGSNGKDDRSTRKRLAGLLNLCSLVLSPAWVQTFVMTFLGEWGDRSQIATIAMAAGQDYWWVTIGAIAGHAICTGVAVVGGRALAGRVSLRVVTIGGAVAFLVFGVIYLFECYSEGSS